MVKELKMARRRAIAVEELMRWIGGCGQLLILAMRRNQEVKSDQ